MNSYPAEFVVQVNEVYHDVEQGAYDDKHPEILADEVARWRRIAARFLGGRADSAGSSDRTLRVLDIGSGTGFVPLQLAPFLREGDTLVCSDVSAGMLEVCRESVEKLALPVQARFQKLDGQTLEFDDAPFDCVTLNSVLHHIPDWIGFLRQCERILVPGGRLIVGHEPNASFFRDRFLWTNFRVASVVFDPLRSAASVLRRVGLFEPVLRWYRRIDRRADAHVRIVAEVNRRLLESRAIEAPLSTDEISEIVDIHSPTAGGVHRDRGIDLGEIERVLKGFSREHLETYNHLCKVSTANRVARWYDRRLCRRFPARGATFLIVLRKTSEPARVATRAAGA